MTRRVVALGNEIANGTWTSGRADGKLERGSEVELCPDGCWLCWPVYPLLCSCWLSCICWRKALLLRAEELFGGDWV